MSLNTDSHIHCIKLNMRSKKDYFTGLFEKQLPISIQTTIPFDFSLFFVAKIFTLYILDGHVRMSVQTYSLKNAI